MRDEPLTILKGIGPRRAESFGKLGLVSLGDLLRLFPRRYQDFSAASSPSACAQGEEAAFCLTLSAEPKLARIRRALSILSVNAVDEHGKTCRLVWYNQPYRGDGLQAGQRVIACGRVDLLHGFKLINPVLYSELPGILPVYPLTAGLPQRVIREAVRGALALCLAETEETLPADLRARYDLSALPYAIKNLHFPEDHTALQAARKRLAFEDMLIFSLMTDELRAAGRSRCGYAFTPADAESFCQSIPFALTGAQRRAMSEIAEDMRAPYAMNRLLQGDVGSGKTIVALYAMATAVQNGKQAVLMAPTEILAVQHAEALKAMFGERTCLLRGGMKKAEREAAYAAIASGEAAAVVGTHALLQPGLVFHDLGLVVADEQHRFGVRQRAALCAREARCVPDMLIMSATPIPRTLSLMIYGDLELSVLDELPPGRMPVQTRYVPQQKREEMMAFILAQVRAGRQAYIVCPLVEASEAADDLLSARALFMRLKAELPVRTGLLHGQMKAAEKERVMAAFHAREIDILVATVVIEVGVDVPNATVMVVENAERFGLAQLHQLRGRVGRGAGLTAYCFLLSQSDAPAARERLSILTKTQDGFLIAQKDLEMRGPGEFLGSRQHGVGVAGFAAIQFAAGMDVLGAAREAAALLRKDAALRERCCALYACVQERIAQLDAVALN